MALRPRTFGSSFSTSHQYSLHKTLMLGATLLFLSALSGTYLTPLPMSVPNLIRAERAIEFADLPHDSRAYNGSIVRAGDLIVMAYRLDSRLGTYMAQTQVAVTQLDENMNPTGPISILESRLGAGTLRYTAEDPRLFMFRGELHVTYNSTQDNEIGGYRQVYMGRIETIPRGDGGYDFHLAGTRQLTLLRPGGTHWMEKSWVPIVADDKLYMLYEHNPAEAYQVPDGAFPLVRAEKPLGLYPLKRALAADEPKYWPFGPLHEGRPSEPVAYPARLPFLSFISQDIAGEAFLGGSLGMSSARVGTKQWPFGVIRGGTPTFALPDGRLGAFFHSGTYFDSGFGYNKHYFMGFYVLASTPPFSIEQIFPLPILPPSYYGPLNSKKILFPAGVIEYEDVYRVSFGQNDAATWFCDVDKQTLFSLLALPDPS